MFDIFLLLVGVSFLIVAIAYAYTMIVGIKKISKELGSDFEKLYKDMLK